jgi:hypothetical protein
MGCGVSAPADQKDPTSSTAPSSAPNNEDSSINRKQSTERSPTLTKEQLDLMNREEVRRVHSGAMGLYCDDHELDLPNGIDHYDSSEYDSDASSNCSRQSSDPSIHHIIDDSFELDHATYKLELKKAEIKKIQMHQQNRLGEKTGVAAGLVSFTNPKSYLNERRDSFEDRENERASALKELRIQHEKNVERKIQERKRKRERQLILNPRKFADGDGNPTPCVNIHKNIEEEEEEEEEENEERRGGRTKHRLIKINTVVRPAPPPKARDQYGSSMNKLALMGDLDSNCNSEASEEPKEHVKEETGYDREQQRETREHAHSIVDEAIEERQSYQKISTAEQGRQKIRSQHKRVKNFFQIDTTKTTTTLAEV